MQLSETEWKVMRQVWKHHPVSVRDVFETLEADTGWAYSTVKTILSRLAEKGALESRMRANVRLFAPLISERQARRSALKTLLNRAFDGTFGALFHHLVADEKLSGDDRDALRQLIEDELGGTEPRDETGEAG